MTSQLPHVVYHAVTCPQFRAELLADFDAALAGHHLEQEDRLALKEALDLFARRHKGELGTDLQPVVESGWNGGFALSTAL